jgi:hypothetical protein
VLIDRLIESILPGGSKFGKLAQDVCGRIYMCLAADFFLPVVYGLIGRSF